jgi:CheY-like chemotaxis protein
MTAFASKLRILVVDDEPSVGNAVKLLLQADGHQVEATNSVKDALTKFEQSRYDLVFTDFAMPEMKGDQLAAAIKTRVPEQPVVMLTAFPGAVPLSANVDHIVGKPFRLQHLREAISKVMPESSPTV